MKFTDDLKTLAYVKYIGIAEELLLEALNEEGAKGQASGLGFKAKLKEEQ